MSAITAAGLAHRAALVAVFTAPAILAQPARDAPAARAQHRGESSPSPHLDAVREQLRRDDETQRSRVERLNAAYQREMARRAAGASTVAASSTTTASSAHPPREPSPPPHPPVEAPVEGGAPHGDDGRGPSRVLWGAFALIGLLAGAIGWLLVRAGRTKPQ